MIKMLFHTGVKGMRWGVRKKRQSTAEGVIRKGDISRHVSGNKDLQLKYGTKGGLYVSYTKKDADFYRNDFVDFLEVTKNVSEIFEYTLKAKEDIVTPSKKKKIDTFLELHKKDTKVIEQMGKNKVTASFFLGLAKYFGHDTSSSQAIKYQKLMNSDKPRDKEKAFNDYAKFLVWEPSLRKKFFAKLAKEGYNAIYDDFDMGMSDVEAPIIVFNPKRSLEIVEKTKIRG